MTEQITKYGPCPVCLGYIKPCKCQKPKPEKCTRPAFDTKDQMQESWFRDKCQDITRLKMQDLKLIKAKVEAMEHSGIFSFCPDVLAKITGAIEGELADIAIDRLK